VAARDGVVTFAGREGPYGLCVRIVHPDGWSTRYAHLRRLYVSEGRTVAAGDALGEVGSSGRSTGRHLHFELLLPDGRPVDPGPWIDGP
jgi:murein DD-endopeptidase MepM/ murein hydrolase activator NlpD